MLLIFNETLFFALFVEHCHCFQQTACLADVYYQHYYEFVCHFVVHAIPLWTPSGDVEMELFSVLVS